MTGDNEQLEQLGKAIEQAEEARSPKRSAPPPSSAIGMSAAFKTASDLLAGVIVGSVAGFLLDRWLGTTPWLFLLCFFLGCAASARLIMRSTAVDRPSDDRSKD